MELCLYNSALTAMSYDGKQFTYVNQLASSDADLSKREEWFTCACCPPNILRLFGQLGGYIWDERKPRDGETELVVHLYVASTVALKTTGGAVQVTQESDFPWKDEIKFTVQGSSNDVTMKLRIPTYAKSYQVISLLNSRPASTNACPALPRMSRRGSREGSPLPPCGLGDSESIIHPVISSTATLGYSKHECHHIRPHGSHAWPGRVLRRRCRQPMGRRPLQGKSITPRVRLLAEIDVPPDNSRRSQFTAPRAIG